MKKEKKQIELRSEKVRNIIGQVPPILLRYGILIISVSLLVLVGITAFISYQPGIDVEITITQTEDGNLHYSTLIPHRAMKNRAKFTEVSLNSSAELPLPTRFEIESISEIVELSDTDAWQQATLRPIESVSENILLDKSTNVPGKILLEKQSVLMWVVGKFFARE
jgi:hypothetical protein